MWVFDGEEWVDEGAEIRKKSTHPELIPIPEFVPELQVIEILPVPQKNEMPLPIAIERHH